MMSLVLTKCLIAISFAAYATANQRACEYFTIGGSNPHPWLAVLGYLNRFGDEIEYSCVGTIISDEFVLTAAHCTPPKEEPVVVRLGDLNSSENEYTVKETIPHPNYSRQCKKNDIALIRLARKIRFDANIYPACLEDNLEDLPLGTPLNIFGCGGYSEGYAKRVAVMTKPLPECNDKYMVYNDKFPQQALKNGINESQYYAYDLSQNNQETNSCLGSGGAPLQVFKQIFNTYSRNTDAAHIVGITSFGVGTNVGSSDLPTIFTRVAYYKDWISSHVWQ